jgi:type III secretion protein V
LSGSTFFANIRRANMRLADIGLIGAIMAVIMMMILPMPPLALDLLIATNISFGILLLLSVLYVAKPLDFSTFPTVLLLTTLFRLAISIATTRMILTELDGGHIVKKFGEMVAGGNLVVGLVVFLIITVVQFIVISKGAERVAEVAARFSLDAMPGKQLSIDSDLRSGLLDKDEARAKRRTLEMESKLHGSLDGAMKFVKGDAIASIIIVIVNLLGGFAVGMFWHDMSARDAMATFSILTIGDGLVAQIPALFSAMAAGLLVTRTTDEEKDADLGPAIANQILRKPHVLLVSGGLALAMGMIPGFPTLVFLTIGSAMILAGAYSHPLAGEWMRKRFSVASGRKETVPEDILLKSKPVTPVEPLLLTVSLSKLDKSTIESFSRSVQQSIDALQSETGISIPSLRIVMTNEEDLPDRGWMLSVFDAPIGSGLASEGDPAALISAAVYQLLRGNTAMFLGLQEVTDLLNRLGETYPEVVKEAVRAVPTGKIAEILRMLAEENVPLRNMRDVIEAIGEFGQIERESYPIAERTRIAVRRHLIAPLCDSGRLRVVMVGSNLENVIREKLTPIDGQYRLAINQQQVLDLISLLRSEIQRSGARAIVTAQDIRRPLRQIIASEIFETPVVSFNELNPNVPLDIIGNLNIAPESLTALTMQESNHP